MSDQLADAGIEVFEGFDPAQLNPAPDLVVIGNANLPRGHPGIEYVLEQGIDYTSGAEWLGRIRAPRTAGYWPSVRDPRQNHHRQYAGLDSRSGRPLSPGYLIGGVPLNFERSARLGDTPFFVVEADEYDTSYFDRRSKFVHYRPRTLIINNLEYDHADIFPGSRGHPDPVPSSVAQRSRHGSDSRPRTRRGRRRGTEDGLLDPRGQNPQRTRTGRILAETDQETGELWSADAVGQGR